LKVAESVRILFDPFTLIVLPRLLLWCRKTEIRHQPTLTRQFGFDLSAAQTYLTIWIITVESKEPLSS